MMGPERQDFWPRINILKGKKYEKSVDELWFVKKCQNRTFKVNFQFQKSNNLKKSFKNINLEGHL